MVAGQLIESVSGQTWEQFVAEHVLRPAGMLHSTSDEDARFAAADRAFPHARMNGGLRGIGDQARLDERDELGRNAAPAGGLAVSADDMARWLMIQLDHGALPGGQGRLFSEAAHEEMWRPLVLQPVTPRPEPLQATQPLFNTYALGWDVRDYRGAKIVLHGCAVFGFLTVVVLIPDRQVGFSIEINSEDGEIINGLTFELLDHYLKQPPNDWPAKFIAYKQQRLQEALKAYQSSVAAPAKVGPSLPLARYTGTYADPWYGNIDIGQAHGKLTIDFKSTPRMSGTLAHWQYDSFVTHFDDPSIEPAYLTFGLDADGKVERITLKAVSPLADFSYDYHDLLFTPVARP
jgi:CubicO group peptidase (beta-lactamase class C family)